MDLPVSVRREVVILPTYEPAAPDFYPMFLDHRVYQGSSGRVYPLPICDRIAGVARPKEWQAVFIENEYLRVMILPELGGRIHRIEDKIQDCDLIYYQAVIKPALVGLAGPWISGGIEFNWPQHHRPSTAMPAEVAIEEHGDGAMTVWLSEHDPMARMKGMHGVCLRPGVARVELRARVYNRSDDVQTFLWWVNIGLEVHERYQSFFPPDVSFVADHAKRAMSTFPLSTGHYYGVNYAARSASGVPEAERPRLYPPGGTPSDKAEGIAYAPNDLSWYANIPVPTSYMCVGSAGDFCGGYDHRAKVGLVHVANHHVAPGKKQWTWGNHEFGYAWDRNLTDPRADGSHPPYIELMAGAYTDNQPDFSYLQPGETKSWSQFLYPIHQIGCPREANTEAAADFRVCAEDGSATLRVAVTRVYDAALLDVLDSNGRVLVGMGVDLAPGKPCIARVQLPQGCDLTGLSLVVRDGSGVELLRYRPAEPSGPGEAAACATEAPAPATAPLAPREIIGADDLYLTGLHLEQYRHATRCPTAYWHEALRRDSGDSRCNLALGRWHLRRGEFTQARGFLEASVARLTMRNPNPADGEAHYQLARCLRYLGCDAKAYAAFYKATWNQAWASAAFLALAEADMARGDFTRAEEHLVRAGSLDGENLRARNLHALVLCLRGNTAQADRVITGTVARDPLDAFAAWLQGRAIPGGNHVCLDLAHDLARAGRWAEALGVLAQAEASPGDGSGPLVAYTRAWLLEKKGDDALAAQARQMARGGDFRTCFTARLEDQTVLLAAIAADQHDARARALLGYWLYDRRRAPEAIAQWEEVVRIDATDAVVWRCLGMAYFNVAGNASRARSAYDRALELRPDDARLVYERDQLWKRTGLVPAQRLQALNAAPNLIGERDDLVVELAALQTQLGRPAQALELLRARQFQPWEGGEGSVLAQYVRACVALGRSELARGAAEAARLYFTAALQAPENLGEARHLLANPSEVYWWLGETCAALGNRPAARDYWHLAAEFKGDFQGMRVRPYSEMTIYSARSLARLGRRAEARRLFQALLKHARSLATTRAELDFFATSLPSMLLFADDLQARQTIMAQFLEAQALTGLGETNKARELLAEILRIDPNHALAADFEAELS